MKTDPITRRGFVLPMTLILLAALVILVVGVSTMVSLERKTSRNYTDRERAELAARAGLQELKTLMSQEMSNDDFLIIPSLKGEKESEKTPDSVFIARGKVEDDHLTFRYFPLFSAAAAPSDTTVLERPRTADLLGDGEPFLFTTLPYLDPVSVEWRAIKNEKGQMVARYAYWVEDLQGKLDAGRVGNLKGKEQQHERSQPPFPAPGLNSAVASADEPPLDQASLYVLDSEATTDEQGRLAKSLIENRKLLLSPASGFAAADLSAPLARGADGHLENEVAKALEENVSGPVEAYLEQSLIPCVKAIDSKEIGKPRLNLNRLLTEKPEVAVNQMADQINKAFPDFVNRKGGLLDDYVKTLAANTIDYADKDSNSTLLVGSYRGLDAYPLMSEIALQIHYLGASESEGRRILTFRFKMFAELVNLTTQPVSGKARLSFEIGLSVDGISSSPGGLRFDSPSLLTNKKIATHDLSKIGDRYWSPEIAVSLKPNQYQCYRFYEVTYKMDVGPLSISLPATTPFSLNETKGAAGLSLRWNNEEVDRIPKILRRSGLIYSAKSNNGFLVGAEKITTKAGLPSVVYDNEDGESIYNTGDPRMTVYLRESVLDESAYPANASPNRRNIRLDIYKADTETKPKVYARVQPSEWPDGGHNVKVGTWTPGSSDKTEMTDAKFVFSYENHMAKSAPQMISNSGRFYSVTELGRVFDPIMYAPKFKLEVDTKSLLEKGKMPSDKTAWPDVDEAPKSGNHGGGNTLRIGRTEHPEFMKAKKPGMAAVGLLDLFHVGQSRSENATEREGPVIAINGHINVNTATRDALRATVAGGLVMDPLLSKRTTTEHLPAPLMAQGIQNLKLYAPKLEKEGDLIADAIIKGRPYASVSQLARLKDEEDRPVFGNRNLYKDEEAIEWSDSAAEEVFARLFESSTVRSRNFRVWIVAQAIAPSTTPEAKPEVLAEIRRAHTLFANPGKRNDDGTINAQEFKPTVTFTNEF